MKTSRRKTVRLLPRKKKMYRIQRKSGHVTKLKAGASKKRAKA